MGSDDERSLALGSVARVVDVLVGDGDALVPAGLHAAAAIAAQSAAPKGILMPSHCSWSLLLSSESGWPKY